MPWPLRDPLHRTWLLLVAATAIAFWLRVDDVAGVIAAGATLAIAWIKGRLVVLDFMELRHAPPLYRRLFEGWVLLVSTLLLALYWVGPSLFESFQ